MWACLVAYQPSDMPCPKPPCATQCTACSSAAVLYHDSTSFALSCTAVRSVECRQRQCDPHHLQHGYNVQHSVTDDWRTVLALAANYAWAADSTLRFKTLNRGRCHVHLARRVRFDGLEGLEGFDGFDGFAGLPELEEDTCSKG